MSSQQTADLHADLPNEGLLTCPAQNETQSIETVTEQIFDLANEAATLLKNPENNIHAAQRPPLTVNFRLSSGQTVTATTDWDRLRLYKNEGVPVSVIENDKPDIARTRVSAAFSNAQNDRPTILNVYTERDSDDFEAVAVYKIG